MIDIRNTPFPSALDAELALIGTFLQYNDILDAMSPTLPLNAFYGSNNRELYKVMSSMRENNELVDVVTVSEKISNNESLVNTLCESVDKILSEVAANDYAKILIDKFIRRTAIELGVSLVDKSFVESTSIDNLLNQSESISEQLVEHANLLGSRKSNGTEIVEVKEFKKELISIRHRGLSNVTTIVNSSWPLFNKHFKISKEKLHIFTGIPSHGKSEFVDMVMVSLALESDWKWLIYSPENYPLTRYIRKLIEKLVGKRFFTLTDYEIEAATDFLNEHFKMVDSSTDNNLTVGQLLRLAKDVIKKSPIDGFLTDPWNQLSHQERAGEREDQYIDRQLAKITRHCRRYSYAKFLVAHPTKLQKDERTGKYPIPNLYSISGGAPWYNKADFGFTVYRNWDELNTVDVHVTKVKDRDNGEVGAVRFVYDTESTQYREYNESVDYWQNK